MKLLNTKYITLALILLSQVMNSHGQKPFYFGVKAGIGGTNLAMDYFTPLGQSRTAISSGLFAQYWINDFIGVNLDVMYAQYGGANVNPRLFYDKQSPMLGIPELNKSIERTDLLMHGIDVPLSLYLSVPNLKSNIKPLLILGGAFGYTFKATVVNQSKWAFDGSPNDLLSVSQDDVTKKLEPVHFAGIVGCGADFSASPVSFTIGVTYRMGITNINNYKMSLYQNYTCNTTQVFVAFKF